MAILSSICLFSNIIIWVNGRIIRQQHPYEGPVVTDRRLGISRLRMSGCGELPIWALGRFVRVKRGQVAAGGVMPSRPGYLPVMMLARVGEQSGLAA